MKYAIVESGGKQYKAVEGETIEVDRLPVNDGEKIGLERVLMLVDDDEVSVGTPTVDGIQVSTTVVEHFKGSKIIVFKYSPRKRIRVKGGHRQQYTRLMVDAIGKPGESRKAKKAEAPAKKTEVKTEKRVEKKEATAVKPAATPSPKGKETEKAPAKTAEKAPATSSPKGKKTPAKKTDKAPAKKAEKTPAKKTTAKKTTTTSSPKGKKTSSTKTTKK